jgi:hypothetical protein
MPDKCAICGTDLSVDLYATVAQEPVCAVCKINWIGGLPTTQERIDQVRAKLLLRPGEYIQQNNAEQAALILGRKAR